MIVFDDAVVDFCGLRSAVAMVQRRYSLRKHFPDEVLADRVLSLAASSDQLLQVASIAVFHNDVYFCSLFVNDAVKVFDNVGVAELPEYVDLRDYLLFLLLTHDAVV